MSKIVVFGAPKSTLSAAISGYRTPQTNEVASEANVPMAFAAAKHRNVFVNGGRCVHWKRSFCALLCIVGAVCITSIIEALMSWSRGSDSSFLGSHA